MLAKKSAKPSFFGDIYITFSSFKAMTQSFFPTTDESIKNFFYLCNVVV